MPRQCLQYKTSLMLCPLCFKVGPLRAAPQFLHKSETQGCSRLCPAHTQPIPRAPCAAPDPVWHPRCPTDNTGVLVSSHSGLVFWQDLGKF